MLVLIQMNLALLALSQKLVLFLEELHDLSVVNLLHALLIDLLLCNLLDFKHDLVQARGINEAMPESLTLVEEEVHIEVPKDLLL